MSDSGLGRYLVVVVAIGTSLCQAIVGAYCPIVRVKRLTYKSVLLGAFLALSFFLVGLHDSAASSLEFKLSSVLEVFYLDFYPLL